MARAPEARVVRARDLAGWTNRAAEAYRSIVTTRLEDAVCRACGASLGDATLTGAAGGSTLPEFDLDDETAAATVAWSQTLTARCARCGGVVTI